MENTYWIMSVNLPDEIQKEIPDFKQGNASADPIINLWNTFKQTPDNNNFANFINAFKNFGVQQPTTDTSNNINVQQVNAGLKVSYSFKKKLMENLNKANKKNYFKNLTQNYFKNNDI